MMLCVFCREETTNQPDNHTCFGKNRIDCVNLPSRPSGCHRWPLTLSKSRHLAREGIELGVAVVVQERDEGAEVAL
jgi:hypothetical protein